MDSSRLERLAPLSGVVFVVLLVVSFIVSGSTPSPDDPPQQVTSFWQDNDSKEIIASILGALAAVFLVWFAGSIREGIARSEGGFGRLGTTAFGGFLIMAVGGLAFSGFSFAAADTAGDVPATVTQTLSVLNGDFFFMIGAGQLIALAALAAATLRHGFLPRWLGFVMIALAVLSFTPVGFIAFLAFLVVALIVSVILYRGQDRPVAARSSGA